MDEPAGRIAARHAVSRTARALERSARLDPGEAAVHLDHHLERERRSFESIGSFTPLPAAAERARERYLADLDRLVAAHRPDVPDQPVSAAAVCRRRPEPKGPLDGFGYSYLDDQLERHGLERPALLTYEGLWGSGSEYAYETLNLVDGRRSVGQIRDAVSAIYGPVPEAQVAGFLDALEAIGLLDCGG
mgnify:CR=1 FL=1